MSNISQRVMLGGLNIITETLQIMMALIPVDGSATERQHNVADAIAQTHQQVVKLEAEIKKLPA